MTKSRMKMWIWITGIIGIVIVVALALFACLSSFFSGETKPQTSNYMQESYSSNATNKQSYTVVEDEDEDEDEDDNSRIVEAVRLAQEEAGMNDAEAEAMINSLTQYLQNNRTSQNSGANDAVMNFMMQQQMQNDMMFQSMMMNQMNQMNQMFNSGMSTASMPNYNTSASYKRICSIHGIEYDIRYGGCPQCNAPQFGFRNVPDIRDIPSNYRPAF